MIKKNLLPAAMIWLLASCTNTGNGPQTGDYEFPTTTSVKSQGMLSLENSGILRIDEMFVADSLLVVCSNQSDKFINVLDRHTGALRNAYLTKGKGAGEILRGRVTGYDYNNKSLSIADLISSKLLTYPIVSEGWPPYKETPLPDVENFGVQQVDGSTWLILNREPGSVVSLLRNNTTIATFFEYPQDGNEPTESKAYAYQGFFLSNADHTRFVYAGSSSDIIEIYALNQDSLRKVAAYGTTYPKYTGSTEKSVRGVIYDRGSKIGFLSVTMSKNLIYLRYSGRNRVSHPDRYALANEVYVVDWTGELKRKIILDTDVYSICVEPDDDVLYATVDRESGCEIVRFEI